MTWLVGAGHRRGCPRTAIFPNSRFTWTWVCWDGSRECLPSSSPPPLLPTPMAHQSWSKVHRPVSLDLDLIYPLSCCSTRSDDSPLSSLSINTPPPPHAVRLKVGSLPMAPCLSWRRPSTFLGPSGPGSPQRSVTGQGPDGVCLCPRSIGVDTHRSGCHAVAAIAHNIILPPPPPAAAGPFFLFILSHQGYTCGYLQPSRRCRVCVPFFLFSSRSLTPSFFYLTN